MNFALGSGGQEDKASLTAVRNIPFAAPEIGEQEIEAVVECLRSGWLTSGSRCKAFEEDFSSFVGGGLEALAVSSCTAGLEVALAALNVGPGDEVITTDFTFSATAMSIVRVGARPALVDINSATLNIDVDQIEAAITPKTKAIIPVHYAGLGCDMEAIRYIAERHHLKVIEDAAHALPTIVNGQMVGSGTSDATVFSFYATKSITTGEGGMVTFRDPSVTKKARALRLHGIDRDVFSRYQAASGSWRYDIVLPGSKSNLSDLVAAIGIVQLKRAWAFYERRKALKTNYDLGLRDLPVILPPDAPHGDQHSWHLYAIRLADSAPVKRDEFIQRMSARGINCSVHFIPLHLLTYWRTSLELSSDGFPDSQKVFESLITLPIFTKLSDDNQAFVIDAIRNILS